MDGEVSIDCGSHALNEAQERFYKAKEVEKCELLELFQTLTAAMPTLNSNRDNAPVSASGSLTPIGLSLGPTRSSPSPGQSTTVNATTPLTAIYQQPGRSHLGPGYVLWDRSSNKIVNRDTVRYVKPAQSIIHAGLTPNGTPRQYPPVVPHTPNRFSSIRPQPSPSTHAMHRMPLQVLPTEKLLDKRLNERSPSMEPVSVNTCAPTRMTSVASPSSPPVEWNKPNNPSTPTASSSEPTTSNRLDSSFILNQTPSICTGRRTGSPEKKKSSVQEKTFPSLVVSVRVTMNTFPPSEVNNERLKLDNQMRKILQMTPAIVTEYLLQQRLLRSEHLCKTHLENCKLGMHTDPSLHAFSGGYVWIPQCCNSEFTSVYYNSIFDKTTQRPTTILKLLYHWACNTSVHNVLQWVKVDNFIVKTYYTFFRAICTTIVHQKSEKLGGTYKRVQVTIVNIGPSTVPSVRNKEAKVDVLAALEEGKKRLRLQVLQNDRSMGDFTEVHDILSSWVRPGSTLVVDFALDHNVCRQFGCTVITANRRGQTVQTNSAVVTYVNTTIPRMFQASLKHLSLQIVQQFLDELVWREMWGPTPTQVFDQMVNNIAELTKLPGPDLITKLRKIASFPFRNWKYSAWESEINQKEELVNITVNGTREETPKNTQHSNSTSTITSPSDPAKPSPESSHPNTICLEPYYYGCIKGEPSLQKTSGDFWAKCHLCSRKFVARYTFLNHLINHAFHGELVNTIPNQVRFSICKLCLIPVKGLEEHMHHQHSIAISDIATACKICNIKFDEERQLIDHMTKVHCELDMPYICEVCNFRTSVYEHMAFHFKRCHVYDKCLQCPFCLKVVEFRTRTGVELPKNQYFFIQHIQKHCLKKLNRECEKCVLSFTNICGLKQHQLLHHSSAKHIFNVHRYKKNPVKRLYINRPVTGPTPPLTLNEGVWQTLKGKALPLSIKVSPTCIDNACLECDSPMTENHFSKKMTCTRCSYQSMCANAIKEHSTRVHAVNEVAQVTRHQIIGGNPLLNHLYYCSACSFSSNNGDRVAHHLSQCRGGTAVTVPPSNNSEPPEKLRKC